MSRIVIAGAIVATASLFGLVSWTAYNVSNDMREAKQAGTALATEPQVTRQIAWSGGNSVELDIPAELVYVQGPTASVSVTGAKSMVDRVRVEAGHIRLVGGRQTVRVGFVFHSQTVSDLRITLTAPDIRSFHLNSSGHIRVPDYRGERLDLAVSGFGDIEAPGADVKELRVKLEGSGDIEVEGQAERLTIDLEGFGDITSDVVSQDVDIALMGSGNVRARGSAERVMLRLEGFGEANLARLDVKDATVELTGAGDASIAPTNYADISIEGFGDVTVTSNPTKVKTRENGAGDIHFQGPEIVKAER